MNKVTLITDRNNLQLDFFKKHDLMKTRIIFLGCWARTRNRPTYSGRTRNRRTHGGRTALNKSFVKTISASKQLHGSYAKKNNA